MCCYEKAVLFLLAFVFLQNTGVRGENIECYSCATDTDEYNAPKLNYCFDDFANPANKKTCNNGEFCYMTVDQNKIRRGCIGDSFRGNKADCEKNPKTCSICDKALCNSKKITMEQCYETTYNVSNPKPLGDGTPKNCTFVTVDNLGCYHQEKNGIVDKGCLSSLTEDKQKDCKSSSDCEICLGEKCNAKVVKHLECFDCEPSKQACPDVSELRNTKDCSLISNACGVGIDANGYTHRLCAANATDDNKKFPKGLETCMTDKCNNQTYPANRPKCFQCQGDQDCEFRTDAAKKKIVPKSCEIYSDNEKCYTYLDEDGKVYRGCMSDKGNSTALCDKNENKCEKCDTSGCNEKPRSAGNSIESVPVKLLIGVTLIVLLSQINFLDMLLFKNN